MEKYNLCPECREHRVTVVNGAWVCCSDTCKAEGLDYPGESQRANCRARDARAGRVTESSELLKTDFTRLQAIYSDTLFDLHAARGKNIVVAVVAFFCGAFTAWWFS